MFERTFSFWRRLVGLPANDAGTASTSEADRRLWVRYATDVPAQVSVDGNGQETRLPARVSDISVGGANLWIDKEVPTGQLISLELPQLGGQATHSVLACVVRSAPDGSGRWAVGCVFSRELGQDDLERFGAQKVRHDPPDKRVWMRFATDRLASFQKIGSPENLTYSAQVINLSASGVGLAVTTKVEPGTLLSLELHNHDGKVSRTILACVVHVTSQVQGSWALGCNFIRELSEKDLRALV